MGIKKWLSSLKSRLGLGKKSKDTGSAAKTDGLLSPGGMSVFVSVGGSESERPDFFNNNTVEFEELPGRMVLFKKCGHDSSPKLRLNIWGNASEAELEDKFITKEGGRAVAENDVCPKCFFEEVKKSAIRCCLCGYAILPGDGVALYRKDSEGVHKDIATFVGDSAIGCLLWDCCPSGGFFAGHWTSDGFKSLFPDNRTAVEEAFCSKKIVKGDI
jgi:hypothetical protein